MGKNRRNLICGVLFLAIVLGVIAWVRWDSREPSYEGKPLSVWLEGYAPNGTQETRWAADEAVYSMGTNAIPILLRRLGEHDSPRMVKLMTLARFINVRYVHSSDHNVQGASGLRAVGSKAVSTVPALMKMFERGDAFSKSLIANVFGSMGPSAKEAIPLLIRATHDGDKYVRMNAIFCLGQIHSKPELVVPTLIQSLNDPDAQARENAVTSLGRFGPDAKAAVPALLQMFEQIERRPRYIEESIKAIDPTRNAGIR
jgi:hypothetical protein